MGYDLMGCKPDAPSGKYFAINNNRWSSFRKMMFMAESMTRRAWSDKEWEAVGSNSGYKVPKYRCLKMAKALREAFEESGGRDAAEKVMYKLSGTITLKKDIPGFEKWESIKVRDERVTAYILFLEHCNGFRCC